MAKWIRGAVFRAVPFVLGQAAAAAGHLDADVIFLGEVHDNPAHHAVQAEYVAGLSPRALVFEMLTPEQAERILPELQGDPARIAEVVEWDKTGWPDFSLYAEIFGAAPQARIYGAGMDRGAARASVGKPLTEVHGAGAERFGLDRALPADEQEAREQAQFEAHCDAMPRDMMGMMVDIQRLRDARIAETALAALSDTGGPVAVITGNGHARRDWGAPALVLIADPDVRLFALGQGEGGVPPGGTFDEVRDADPVDRPDPCAVFRN